MDNFNELLGSIPYKKNYKDGDETVECQLIFVPSKQRKWCCGYYSFSEDYWLICGYGNTITEALLHLKRQLSTK